MIIKNLSGDYSYSFGQWHFETDFNNTILFGYIRWRYGSIEIHVSENKENIGKLIYCQEHDFYDEEKYKNTINQELEKICLGIDLNQEINTCKKSGIKGSYKDNMEFIQQIDKYYPDKWEEIKQTWIYAKTKITLLERIALRKDLNEKINIEIPKEVNLFLKLSLFDKIKDIT